MPLTRRDFLKAGLATVVVGGPIPTTSVAPDPLQEERPVFTLPQLDPAHDGLRIALLSDFHVGDRTSPELILDAVRRANAFKPDLVVLTGDYLTHRQREVGFARELLHGFESPTIAVLGNHDHSVDPRGIQRVLSGLGYAVLRNENTTLRLRGAPFTIIGIDDLLSGHAAPRKAMAGARPGSRLVLAHGPKTADALQATGEALLCFSGHTHGGQIHIPWFTPTLLRALVHEPYARGRYLLGKVQLYVNRGIGNSAISLRINSAPEVTLATLRCATSASAS